MGLNLFDFIDERITNEKRSIFVGPKRCVHLIENMSYFLCNDNKMPNHFKNLFECVSYIYDHAIEKDGHFIFSGKAADVGRIEQIYFDGTNYTISKVLYAFDTMQHPSTIRRLHKICQEHRCVEPYHHIECEADGDPMDIASWTDVQRKKLIGRLGLLDFDTKENECAVFEGWKDEKGYGHLQVNGKTYYVHRLALQLKLNRQITDGNQASHICGNASCVNPNHLVEESVGENNRRKDDHGTVKRKISKEDCVEVRRQKGCQSASELSEQYGVSVHTIYRIWQDQEKKRKPTRNLFIFTDDMHKEISYILKNKCLEIEEDGIKHLIPSTTCRDKGYAPTAFHGYYTYYHILAAIFAEKKRHFPNAKLHEFCLHRCIRKDCCNPEHMYISSHKQNMQDKRRDGTNRNHSTISDENVLLIRKAPGRIIDVARQFQVSEAIVKSIRRGVSHSQVVENMVE